MTRDQFYKTQILKFIRNKNAKILVLGAGSLDERIFKELNYSNVVYSNIENTTEENVNYFVKNESKLTSQQYSRKNCRRH